MLASGAQTAAPAPAGKPDHEAQSGAAFPAEAAGVSAEPTGGGAGGCCMIPPSRSQANPRRRETRWGKTASIFPAPMLTCRNSGPLLRGGDAAGATTRIGLSPPDDFIASRKAAGLSGGSLTP